MSKEDRLLTSSEYAEFKRICQEAEDADHWRRLAELLAEQTKIIQDQNTQIKILEDFIGSKQEKLLKLEHTLELLEKELMKIR